MSEPSSAVEHWGAATVPASSSRPTGLHRAHSQPEPSIPLVVLTPAIWQGERASSQFDEHGEPPRARRIILVSNEMVMEAALPRAPQMYGLAQAVARSVGLTVALAGLVSAAYLAAVWSARRGVGGVAIGAVSAASTAMLTQYNIRTRLL